MFDTYGRAWRILRDRIVRSRRQTISRTDLMYWQLQALEQAVNEHITNVVANTPPMEDLLGGQQEKA